LEDKVEEDVSAHFDKTYDFIKECLKDHNVLVHCQFGRSRSASILIAFLMRELNLPYSKVYELVFEKRNQLQINAGFDEQLKAYEKKIFKE
jgi:protein-tyrosine phosphatase